MYKNNLTNRRSAVPMVLAALTLTGGPAWPQAGPQNALGKVAVMSSQDAPAPLLVRRVIVLTPAGAGAISPQTQKRADQTAQRLMAARPKGKGRRRSRRAATAPRNVAAPVAALPVAAIPADPIVKGRAGEIVPPEQQNALAQALLSDLVIERLRDRMGLAVVPDTEARRALAALRLTVADLEDPARPENARRLCALLGCQALLIPRLAHCALKDGLTRNVSLWGRVTIQTLPANSAQTTGAYGLPAARQEGEGVDAKRWPTHLDTAGAASSERVLFHSSYQKPQSDLIRDAAAQSASLLAHTLQAGETAPLMQYSDRLAVAPVISPMQADKLVFTARGRRVYPAAARHLSGDVSALWTPDLLPLTGENVVDAAQTRHVLAQERRAETYLWKDVYRPDLPHIQALAHRLGVGYVLLARVTDVELDEGAADRSAIAIAEQPTPANNAPERSARAEALALLVRTSDGAILWRERATSTLTTSPDDRAALSSDADLARDASHFALVDLGRRFRHWRGDFEK